MPFAKPLPVWNAPGVDIPQALIDGGWALNDYPPADFFNRHWYLTYQALKELQEKAAEKTDIVAVEDASLTKKGVVQLSNSTGSTSESLAATPKAVKLVADALGTKETPAGAQLKADHTSHVRKWLNEDVNGIFTTVEYYRTSDKTLAARAVLSGGTSPLYTARTITKYAADGVTALVTVTCPLTYNANGVLISEV